MQEEFLELLNKWYSSYVFSAHGRCEPTAKTYYEKLKEWCKNHRGDALLYIRELLMKEPNDAVFLLDDIYKEEFDFEVDGFCPLDSYCNLWLNVTDPEFDHEHIKDYYEDWRAWNDYLKENYISWNPFKENDPNITLEEFKKCKHNKDKL